MNGKIIGGVIGAIIGGPLGAGLGVFLGACADEDDKTNALPEALWLFTKSGQLAIQCPHCAEIGMLSQAGSRWNCNKCHKEMRFEYYSKHIEAAKSGDFYNKSLSEKCIFQTLGVLTRADGNCSGEEVDFADEVMHRLGLNDEESKICAEYFKHGYNSGDFGFAVLTLGNIFASDYNTRISLMRMFFEICCSDGEFHRNEYEVLAAIGAEGLGIEEAHFKTLAKEVLEEYLADRSDDNLLLQALRCLESTREMSLEEIKKNYHRLCKSFHPDTISNKQLPPEFIKFAHDKMLELNKAFEIVSSYYESKAA